MVDLGFDPYQVKPDFMQYLYMESVVDLGFDLYQVKPDFMQYLYMECHFHGIFFYEFLSEICIAS